MTNRKLDDLAAGAADASTPSTIGSLTEAARKNILERATREVNERTVSLARGDHIGLGAVEKAIAEGRLGGNRDEIYAALGVGRSPLSKSVNDLLGARGMDAERLADLKATLGGYESATAALNDRLAKGLPDREMDKLLTPSFELPAMPELPPNPIYETNALLKNMVEEIVDQRDIVKVTATAQQRETELLSQLIEAFTASQVASDRAARRSHIQAWIGIGIAIITPLIAVLLG